MQSTEEQHDCSPAKFLVPSEKFGAQLGARAVGRRLGSQLYDVSRRQSVTSAGRQALFFRMRVTHAAGPTQQWPLDQAAVALLLEPAALDRIGIEHAVWHHQKRRLCSHATSSCRQA